MKRWLGFCTAILLVACSDGDKAIQLGTQPDRVEVAPDGHIRLFRQDKLQLSFDPDAFQLGLVDKIDEEHSYDPYWLDLKDELLPSEPPPGLRWRVPTSATVLETAEEVVVELVFSGSTRVQVKLQFAEAGHYTLQVLPQSSAPIGFIRVRVRVDAEEGFYGLGGAPDHVMHRGFIRPMQMEPNLGIESSNNEIHVPVPLLIGTRGWGLFVESQRLGVFDVATEDPRLVEITYGTAEQSDQGLLLHLFSAAHPLDILGAYYRVTGAPLLPARWAYGPLIWRNDNEDQAEVEDDIAKIRELDLATSGIWIDRPYATAVNTFDFDATLYPDPSAMIQTAHDAGLAVALWHTPYLEPAAGALAEEASTKGYFVPQTGLRLNGWSDPIDFTNPEAYDWWQGLIRRYTDLGIEGFKLDYGEDLLPGLGGARNAWAFADGSTDRTMHYGYTRLYHQVYAETLPESGGLLLCRTGRWGDQRNVSVIWPGDLDADLSRYGESKVDASGDRYVGVGGLPTSIIMDLNLGASGFPFYGADTGGYRRSPPNLETWMRWVQQTALSTVMQVGDASSQPPWVYNATNGRSEDTLAFYRKYARLHMRLFPYVWTYAEQLASTGRPISRALGLAYPELGVHPADTYMFGDELLVAPVVQAGARNRQVVLPKGRWLSWWDGEVLESSAAEITVDAPLDRLPLFVRAGALVPMLRPSIDTLAPVSDGGVDSYATDAGLVWVRVAPAADELRRDFEVFDGTKLWQAQGVGLELGYSPGRELNQGVVFEVYRTSKPQAVTLAGTAVPEVPALDAVQTGWRFNEGRLFVKVAWAEALTVRIQ